MSYHCFKCSTEITLPVGGTVGRRETCLTCDSDLHVCLNCVHHDRNAYNECREPQAERVLEKERSNGCEHFAMRSGLPSKSSGPNKGDILKGLDDLFKK